MQHLWGRQGSAGLENPVAQVHFTCTSTAYKEGEGQVFYSHVFYLFEMERRARAKPRPRARSKFQICIDGGESSVSLLLPPRSCISRKLSQEPQNESHTSRSEQGLGCCKQYAEHCAKGPSPLSALALFDWSISKLTSVMLVIEF